MPVRRQARRRRSSRRRRSCRFLAIVHGPEPQPSGGIDDAVVEAVAGNVRLDLDDQRECAVRLVEMMKADCSPATKPPRSAGRMKPTCSGALPAAPLAAGRIEAVDLLLLDVDEPQRAVALDPDRPFAELAPRDPRRRSDSSRSGSAPARVDEIFVAGDAARVSRGEEEHERGDVVRHQAAFQALRVDDLGLVFGRVPFASGAAS